MAYKNKEIRNPITGQHIRFIKTANDTNGQLLEMESTYSPHSTEPVAHYHPHQSEDFVVLSGKMMVRINAELRVLERGETLHIAPNSVHAMWNANGEPATVNWKVRPAMNTEHLLETTFGLVADGKATKKGMPGLLQTALTINKYNPVFRMARPSFVIQKIVFSLLSPFSYLTGKKPDYKKYLD